MEKRIPLPPKKEVRPQRLVCNTQINESDPRRGDFRKNEDSLLSLVSAMLGGTRFEGYATRFDESRGMELRELDTRVDQQFFFFFPFFSFLRNFAENFETRTRNEANGVVRARTKIKGRSFVVSSSRGWIRQSARWEFYV